MNILVINHYAGSDVMGMEFRPFYIAREWVKRGNQVTILTASHSHLRIHNPHIDQELVHRITQGIHYLYIKTRPYTGNGWARVENVFDFLSKSYLRRAAIRKIAQPQVVIVSSTYPFDFLLGRKIAKETGAKLVFELHDIWPLSLIELHGYPPQHPLMRWIDYHERMALENADLVVSLLPNAQQYFAEEGITVKQYIGIPNGVALPLELPLRQAERQIAELQKYREAGEFLVMYCGGFSQANHLDYLIDSAKYVGGNIRIIGVGNGPKRRELVEYAEAMGIKNISFLDAVDRGQLFSVMEQADCLYLGAKASPLYQYGVSMNKIFDYMLAGKPVIYAIDSPNNPLDLANCGIQVDPHDSSQVGKAILQIKAMSPAQRREMGQRGTDYVKKNHDYRILAKRYLTAMEERKHEKTQ